MISAIDAQVSRSSSTRRIGTAAMVSFLLFRRGAGTPAMSGRLTLSFVRCCFASHRGFCAYKTAAQRVVFSCSQHAATNTLQQFTQTERLTKISDDRRCQELRRKLFLRNLPGQDYRRDAPARPLLAQVFQNPIRAAPEQIEVQRHHGWNPVTQQCQTVQPTDGRGHVKTVMGQKLPV